MKVRGISRPGELAIGMACAFLCTAVIYAYADLPATRPASTDGVEHRWVVARMGYLPYTEPSETEHQAMVVAGQTLDSPPLGVIRSADLGYESARQPVTVARSLSITEPEIVAHEVVVWNEDVATRLLVSSEGPVRSLGAGSVQELLTGYSAATHDQGDRDALEVGIDAFDVAAGIDPDIAPALGGLVTAHYVGFADDDGTHVIVRVGADGAASFVEY